MKLVQVSLRTCVGYTFLWILLLRVSTAVSLVWTTITYDDFQDGWGNFATVADSDGDATWDAQALRIQNNSGNRSSVFLSTPYNVAAFQDLRVSFSYHAQDMEDGESFLLEYLPTQSGSWQVVKRYVAGIDFSNSDRSSLSIITFSHRMDEAMYELTDAANIRFRCEASSSNDFVFLDEIRFQGLEIVPTESPSSTPPTSMPSWNPTNIPTRAVEVNCPLDRSLIPEKFEMGPYADDNPNDAVEDDLFEISSIAYSEQVDSNGLRYAYMVSDKEQYSLKVIRFTANTINGNPINGQGFGVAAYTLFTEEPLNDDWEDISLGPCTDINTTYYTTDQTCIYIGNIGNNNRPPKPQRENLYIYKFVEPLIGSDGPMDQIVQFATIEFRYGNGFDQSEGRYYDAEALFVDWTGVVEGNNNNDENQGDIYVSTKGGCSGGVGKIPVSVHRDLGAGELLSNFSMARVVGVVDVPIIAENVNVQISRSCRDGWFGVWTGADMRRDGQLIAFNLEGAPGSGGSVYFFPRASNQSVREALSGQPCNFVATLAIGLEDERKYEAVAFVDPAGIRLAHVSECSGVCTPSVFEYDLEYIPS